MIPSILYDINTYLIIKISIALQIFFNPSPLDSPPLLQTQATDYFVYFYIFNTIIMLYECQQLFSLYIY